MTIVKQLLTLTLVGIFLLTACTTDAPAEKIDIDGLLAGRWELSEAVRNGKKAPTMEGTYFEFKPDKSMSTNMMGSDQMSTFTRTERIISTTANGLKTDYTIEKITTDSLQLSTTIRNFKFNLSLLRAK